MVKRSLEYGENVGSMDMQRARGSSEVSGEAEMYEGRHIYLRKCEV